jgi:hypothetical protein
MADTQTPLPPLPKSQPSFGERHSTMIYALLMGAIALFIVLAVVMYVTRKVDWYARDAS